MTPKINKTFIIRHKDTQEQWVARSGKSSWKSASAAKNAWAQSDHRNTKGISKTSKKPWRDWYEYPKFNEQALSLLEELFEVCPQDYLIEDDLDIRINSFFAGVGEDIDENK